MRSLIPSSPPAITDELHITLTQTAPVVAQTVGFADHVLNEQWRPGLGTGPYRARSALAEARLAAADAPRGEGAAASEARPAALPAESADVGATVQALVQMPVSEMLKTPDFTAALKDFEAWLAQEQRLPALAYPDARLKAEALDMASHTNREFRHDPVYAFVLLGMARGQVSTTPLKDKEAPIPRCVALVDEKLFKAFAAGLGPTDTRYKQSVFNEAIKLLAKLRYLASDLSSPQLPRLMQVTPELLLPHYPKPRNRIYFLQALIKLREAHEQVFPRVGQVETNPTQETGAER